MTDPAAPDTRPLDGQTVLILGSGGIGTAAAQHFARDGASIVLGDRDIDRLESARAEITQRVSDATVQLVEVDALDADSVERAVTFAAKDRGRLDACITTVGGSILRPIAMMNAEDFRSIFDLNATSAFLAIRACLPVMREHGGAIVCTSSVRAVQSDHYQSAYIAAKAALEGLVRAAADELGSLRIRVNAVRPGITDSNPRSRVILDDDAVSRSYLANTPLGRLGLPDDIAAAIRFLGGPESSWATGSVVTVDGGNTLRSSTHLDHLVDAQYGRDSVDLARRGYLSSNLDE